MTEKEKMLAGEIYDTRDPELIARYTKVRALLRKYNCEALEHIDQREGILAELLGTPGSRNWIEAPFYCDYGENIHLGNDIFINYNCTFVDNNTIMIGDGTLLAPGCVVATAEHPIAYAQRNIQNPNGVGLRFTTQTRPIVIGKGCWIGANVTICPGVTIGDGCVVGAGSVVTNDLPAHTVCYGVPCKPRRSTEA